MGRLNVPRLTEMKVDLREIDGWNERLKELVNEAEFEALLDDTAKKVAQVYLNNVMRITNVDTGELRRNWDIVRGRDYYQVYNNTYYGVYVNYGHRQQPGRYVPAIGKRLKKSWVEGYFFVERAGHRTQKEVEKIVRHSLIEPLKRYLNE